MIHHARERQEIIALLKRGAFLYDESSPRKRNVNQLEHGLQTASRAERENADPELIAVALLHDAARPLTEIRHGEAIAEILYGRISSMNYYILKTHGEFQSDLSHNTTFSSAYSAIPWYPDACKLARWDAASFDPAYDTLPLKHFLPVIDRLYMEKKTANG